VKVVFNCSCQDFAKAQEVSFGVFVIALQMPKLVDIQVIISGGFEEFETPVHQPAPAATTHVRPSNQAVRSAVIGWYF